MANASDILRYIDSIARDKEIDKESLIVGIEQAMAQALAKKYGVDDIEIMLDRDTGEFQCNYDVSMEEQGRIFAMSVTQAIISKVREAERDVIYDEFETKLGEIVSGTIQRFEGDTVIVNLGRNIEGILPRSEKVRSENYNVGERIRALVYEVKKVGPRVKVILSRTHRDLVRALFELEVPEIADGTIMIRRIEREPGYRTKLAVDSADDKVDCVGACVGVRGNRIKSIIDELNGERIDIIRWNNDPVTLIANALKPSEVGDITLDPVTKKALVIVNEDQQSLAIGRRGQNVRLASKLTGWDIDIMTRAELERSVEAEDIAAEGGDADAIEIDDVDPEAPTAAPDEASAGEPAADPAAGDPAAGDPAAEDPAAATGEPGSNRDQTAGES
ncbi:MAG: transcription termination factor NusA [Planctomycetes bacterium]|nr:transcription termination factor NusA [Planctomycetota bacterium]